MPSVAASHRHVGTHLKGLEQGNNISESKAAKLNVEEALGLQN